MAGGEWLVMRIGTELYGVECRRCEHRVVFVTKALADLSGGGPNTFEHQLLAVMKCTRCGHKGAIGWPMDGRKHANAWLNAATPKDLDSLPKRRL